MRSRGLEISGIGWARFSVIVGFIIAMPASLLLKPPTTLTLSAQQNVRYAGSWLDRPVTNWNRKSRELPTPVLPVDQQDIETRCPNLLRQPDSPHEREIIHAGWLLYGAAQSYGVTRIVTAMSSADSLCRPLGYQAFVYFGNTYGGTLSPVAMDSLTNGALLTIRLLGPTNISAEFARYRQHDLPGCPTRMSYVSYEASNEDAPLVTPVEIVTKPLCAPETAASETSKDVERLFDGKWRVSEIRGVTLKGNNPYIRFERAAKLFSGNSGCNQIAGGFEINSTNLTFPRVFSTKMACLDEGNQQLEADFIKALEQTRRFQFHDGMLRFYDANSLLLVFELNAREAVREPDEAQVTGTVSYLEPVSLSPDAILEVRLLDVSQADLPALAIAEQVIRPAGEQIPFAFELHYDPARINQDHEYVIEARIFEGGKNTFLSTDTYPVITHGHPRTAHVIVKPVG